MQGKESAQQYSLMQDSTKLNAAKQQPVPQQNQVTSEFDDLHQMIQTHKQSSNEQQQYGVPQKRVNGSTSNYMNNVSQTSSQNNDVAFNDSAYRLGGTSQMTGSRIGADTYKTNTTIQTHHQAASKGDNQMTYFLFKSLKLRRSTLTVLVTGFLIMSLLMERFCFIVTVYKTKYYGYVLILIVIMLNCIFNFALTRLRKKKQKKRLHELFNIERTPTVGWCIVGIIGALDMLYAFFLFWPANMIPIWLLVSLLQFFIPLNMLFRSCCIGLKHYTIHVVAGFVILTAVVVNMVDITNSKEDKDRYMHYALLFLLCSLFDVVSHALKESIVRSQPLNQEKFNFRISVAQLVVGIIITPFILQVSKEYEDYSNNTQIPDPKSMTLSDFIGSYFSEGLSCLVMIDNPDDTCNYSFIYLLGYVFSLFVLQLSLTYLMSAKSTRNARVTFSFMVPLTLIAFMLASLAETTIEIGHPDWLDIIAVVVVGVGVWLYNWFEERPQKASIENL